MAARPDTQVVHVRLPKALVSRIEALRAADLPRLGRIPDRQDLFAEALETALPIMEQKRRSFPPSPPAAGDPTP